MPTGTPSLASAFGRTSVSRSSRIGNHSMVRWFAAGHSKQGNDERQCCCCRQHPLRLLHQADSFYQIAGCFHSDLSRARGRCCRPCCSEFVGKGALLAMDLLPCLLATRGWHTPARGASEVPIRNRTYPTISPSLVGGQQRRRARVSDQALRSIPRLTSSKDRPLASACHSYVVDTCNLTSVSSGILDSVPTDRVYGDGRRSEHGTEGPKPAGPKPAVDSADRRRVQSGYGARPRNPDVFRRNTNSASGSMKRRISHGQATRSTFTFSRVTHRMAQFFLSIAKSSK